jgi:hypothetical protein
MKNARFGPIGQERWFCFAEVVLGGGKFYAIRGSEDQMELDLDVAGVAIMTASRV